MNAVATYLLLKLKDPEAEVTKDKITEVLNVTGAEVDGEEVDRLIAAMAEKSLDELLEEGYKKLVNVGGGGGGGGAAAGRRVYVGNLNWDCQWQELKDHMRSVGEVLHADVLLGSDGRSKGCGLVEFSTPEEAQRAIQELNDTELMGRMIFVREDREARSEY